MTLILIEGGFAVDFAATRQCICREARSQTATDQYNTGLNPGRPTGECVLCVDARAGVTGKLRTRSAARCSKTACCGTAHSLLTRAWVNGESGLSWPQRCRLSLICFETVCVVQPRVKAGDWGRQNRWYQRVKKQGRNANKAISVRVASRVFFWYLFLVGSGFVFCARGPAVTNGDGPNGREYNN
jgi:hypothetical protein